MGSDESPPVGAIVGGVAAVCVCAALWIALFLYVRRKSAKAAAAAGADGRSSSGGRGGRSGGAGGQYASVDALGSGLDGSGSGEIYMEELPSLSQGGSMGGTFATGEILAPPVPIENGSDYMTMDFSTALCEDCETRAAKWSCHECDLIFCDQCRISRHRKGKLRQHRIVLFDPNKEFVGNQASDDTPAAGDASAPAGASPQSYGTTSLYATAGNKLKSDYVSMDDLPPDMAASGSGSAHGTQAKTRSGPTAYGSSSLVDDEGSLRPKSSANSGKGGPSAYGSSSLVDEDGSLRPNATPAAAPKGKGKKRMPAPVPSAYDTVSMPLDAPAPVATTAQGELLRPPAPSPGSDAATSSLADTKRSKSGRSKRKAKSKQVSTREDGDKDGKAPDIRRRSGSKSDRSRRSEPATADDAIAMALYDAEQ
jgi:hypothetical protein